MKCIYCNGSKNVILTIEEHNFCSISCAVSYIVRGSNIKYDGLCRFMTEDDISDLLLPVGFSC